MNVVREFLALIYCVHLLCELNVYIYCMSLLRKCMHICCVCFVVCESLHESLREYLRESFREYLA